MDISVNIVPLSQSLQMFERPGDYNECDTDITLCRFTYRCGMQFSGNKGENKTCRGEENLSPDYISL